MSFRKSAISSKSGQKSMEVISSVRAVTPQKYFESLQKSPDRTVGISPRRSSFAVVFDEGSRPRLSQQKDSSLLNNKQPGIPIFITLDDLSYRPSARKENFVKKSRDVLSEIKSSIITTYWLMIAVGAVGVCAIGLLLWSLIEMTIAPVHRLLHSPRIYIKISSSGLANSRTIIDFGLALSHQDPLLLIIVIGFAFLFIWIAMKRHDFLVEIDRTVVNLITTRFQGRH